MGGTWQALRAPPYKGDCVPLTPPAAKKGGVLGEP